jgi:hypothetical protein
MSLPDFFLNDAQVLSLFLFAGKAPLATGEMHEVNQDIDFLVPIDDQHPVVIDGGDIALVLDPGYIMNFFGPYIRNESRPHPHQTASRTSFMFI